MPFLFLVFSTSLILKIHVGFFFINNTDILLCENCHSWSRTCRSVQGTSPHPPPLQNPPNQLSRSVVNFVAPMSRFARDFRAQILDFENVSSVMAEMEYLTDLGHSIWWTPTLLVFCNKLFKFKQPLIKLVKVKNC